MSLGYNDTPIIPGTNYHVHDGDRPQPRVVTPGTFSSQEAPGAPPSDAIILFDGTSLDGWKGNDGEAKWKVENGYAEVVPGTGNIQTKDHFGSVQLHIEFAAPEVVKGDGQGRGNSGVFLMGLYEVQVLDNYQNPTYPDGTVGGIYGQFPPLVNAAKAPGHWSVYDIVWEAPVFDGETLVTPAYLTVFLNGIVL
ncbi:MAG: 3-keto-disaccharide hydrolase, partial [Fimbriimonas sp.]